MEDFVFGGYYCTYSSHYLRALATQVAVDVRGNDSREGAAWLEI